MNLRNKENEKKQVLVVDDELPMRAALQANFRRQGWEAEIASCASEAVARLRDRQFPLVVTDIRMPDGDGLQVMRQARALRPETAVILLTAYGNVPDAVQAMKSGACDYLVKPVSFETLYSAVQRVMARVEEQAVPVAEHEIIGKAPSLIRVLERARQAANTDADVLVEAESGTGKELLARLIHDSSRRKSRAFVAVNCAAVPEHLLESELFGHVRGAFTGATGSRPGKFEQAHGGTLLLDEVGEMPLNLQPKLLRVLQERELDRLGDSCSVHVDIRVIATTNRSLGKLVEEGAFRPDLYYRLNVIPLTLPPLRERIEDIPLLAEYFSRKYAKESAMPLPRFTPEFLNGLKGHAWPGNVRELANFIRRVMALSNRVEIGDECLEATMLCNPQQKRGNLLPGTSLREVEKRLLEVTLESVSGNRTRAAEMLGVSLRTVRNKIRDYGLPRRSYA